MSRHPLSRSKIFNKTSAKVFNLSLPQVRLKLTIPITAVITPYPTFVGDIKIGKVRNRLNIEDIHGFTDNKRVTLSRKEKSEVNK